MKKKIILLALAFGLLGPGSAFAGTDNFRKALELYEAGMFSSARHLFEQEPGCLAEGYAVMCSQIMGEKSSASAAARYLSDYPKSSLAPQIRFLDAEALFGEGKYSDALVRYDLLEESVLPDEYADDYLFHKSYCQMEAGSIAKASEGFAVLESRIGSRYRMPSRYYLGYAAYLENRIEEAGQWFEMSVKDPRFEQISSYYLVECRFLQKDYDYVIKEGPAMLETAPEGTNSQLSRMISEAYMVTGNPVKAKEYYDLEVIEGRKMDRSDYFHAGSVLFGVKDYKGAIENFLKVADRADSISQVAYSRLGYSYIKVGDKVSALYAFNEAAKTAFDLSLQEDACFNYAKLAFDVNHDSEGFKAYLARYQDARRGEKIYDYMAITELFNKDYSAAIAYYDKIEKLSDSQMANYAKANFLRASQLIEAGSANDAIPYFKAASLCFPKNNAFNQISKYQLAEAAYKAGKYEHAALTFSELYNVSALHGRQEGKLLPYNIAYSYFKAGNFSSAARWFDTYLYEGDPYAREDALFRRGDCDFYRNDYKSAKSAYQKASEESGAIYPLYSKALCCGLLGDKSGKLDALKLASAKDKNLPYWPEAMYELGRCYVDSGNEKEAVMTFERLKENVDDRIVFAKATIGEGMAYRNSSKYDEALVCYKSVVNEMQGSEYAQDALAAIESIYQSMRRPELYLEYLESIKADLGKTPAEREKMYFNTAERIYLAGNFEQAEMSFAKYMAQYPQGTMTGEALFYMADSQKQQGRKEQALDSFVKAAAALPEGSFREQAMVNIANLNFSLERFEEACNAYDELFAMAEIEQNKTAAAEGRLRSAYKAKKYEDAIKASESVKGDESNYIRAQSCMALSRRDEALEIFAGLAKSPSTPFGAEATVILIQDTYNRGQFADVPAKVFDFSKKAGNQSYWLAKAYIILGDSYAERGNFAQANATFESIRNGYTEKDDVMEGVEMRLNKLSELTK